jgi:hypothetical protein
MTTAVVDTEPRRDEERESDVVLHALELPQAAPGQAEAGEALAGRVVVGCDEFGCGSNHNEVLAVTS